MFRVSMFTLLAGMVSAVLSYTPTAAQWLTIGREQGYVPETVPPEMTDPPLMAGAALTVLAFVAAMLVKFAGNALGWGAVKTAAVTQQVQQRLESECRRIIPPQGGSGTAPAKGSTEHGREIISNRTRRKEIVRELAEAEAERLELVTEQIRRVKEERDLNELIGAAELNRQKASYELDKRVKDLDALRVQRRTNELRAAEVTERLTAVCAVKCELQQEQWEIT